MKLNIYGHPNQLTQTRWNCGRFRERHNQIIKGLKKVLDEKGVEYTVITAPNRLSAPCTNQHTIPYSTVLDTHDIIVLNDKISWSKEKFYSIYFHVKNCKETKVTYNCRAGLAGCIGTSIDARNFKGFCYGKVRIKEKEADTEFGCYNQFFSNIEEDENNEIDIESFVDFILMMKKKYEELGKKHIKAVFANDMMFTMVKAMVVESIHGIEDKFAGKEIEMTSETPGSSATWKVATENRVPLLIKVDKCSSYTKVCIRTVIDYSNKSEYDILVNKDNSREARVYIPSLLKNLKDIYNSKVTFRFNINARNED